MWVICTVAGFFFLALLIPVSWSLRAVWRKTRGSHAVTCPGIGEPAVLHLDQWYAVRMHARGDAELRVKGCSQWPEQSGCARRCLAQIATTQEGGCCAAP
jgi:hypothetical protein